MTKQKQRNNPKFEFLFGGPFHQYYLRQVKAQHTSEFHILFDLLGDESRTGLRTAITDHPSLSLSLSLSLTE